MQRESEHQITLLDQQQLARRKEIAKEPVVDGEETLDVLAVRVSFKSRIIRDVSLMALLYEYGVANTTRLDAELGTYLDIFSCYSSTDD